MTKWITDWERHERFPYYTRANAGEVLPWPVSPLGWTMCWEGGLLKGWRDGFIEFGVFREDELREERPPVVGTFAGHFYINLSATRMNGARIPGLTVEAFDAAVFGAHPDVPPYNPDPRDECTECTEKITGNVGWVLTAEAWPEIVAERDHAIRQRAERPTLASLSDAELVARARATRASLRNGFRLHVRSTLASTIGPGIIGATLEAVGRQDLTMALMSAVGDVDSALPAQAMWRLSRLDPDGGEFRTGFEAFLIDHGCRGPNEWDPRADSWETKPALAVALIDTMRKAGDAEDPSRKHDRLKGEREDATNEVAGMLAGDAEARGTFLAGVRATGLFMASRERTKTNLIRVINEVRVALRELGRRGAEAGIYDDPRDVFLIMDAELDAYLADPASFKGIIAERAAGFADLNDIDPPFIIKTDIAELEDWPRKGTGSVLAVSDGEVLAGAPGCPGRYTGTARVVLDPADPFALEPGEVLIAPLTDPSWTPLFVAAGAVIVDVGAPNSHAIIVSRELGIPCVVSVTDATRRIPDGATVTVDGATGQVTIVSASWLAEEIT